MVVQRIPPPVRVSSHSTKFFREAFSTSLTLQPYPAAAESGKWTAPLLYIFVVSIITPFISITSAFFAFLEVRKLFTIGIFLIIYFLMVFSIFTCLSSCIFFITVVKNYLFEGSFALKGVGLISASTTPISFIIPISVCLSNLSRVAELAVAMLMTYYITSSISIVYIYKDDRERILQSIYYTVVYYLMILLFMECTTFGNIATLYFAFRKRFF